MGVDHTTVGRRDRAAEDALGVRLFTRTAQGYVPTADALRLSAPMQQVEDAVHPVERGAVRDELDGTIRITSPETLGVSYLAPRLAALSGEHPCMTIEFPCGEVLDLGNREAEVAVRTFRSSYLERRPAKSMKLVSPFSLAVQAEPLWLTVHRELKATRRVRVVLDYLASAMQADARLFRGRAG